MPPRIGSRALYLGLRGFLEVGSRLPPALTRAIGRGLGHTALRLSSKYRTRVRKHVDIAYPELEPSARAAIASDTARHFGNMLAEIA